MAATPQPSAKTARTTAAGAARLAETDWAKSKATQSTAAAARPRVRSPTAATQRGMRGAGTAAGKCSERVAKSESSSESITRAYHKKERNGQGAERDFVAP